MILAAGRGERMRPLTNNTPKPLLKVKGIALIEYHIKNLVAAGIKNIVINHAWLGQKLIDYLGNGDQYNVSIEYSEEVIALETAGGIIQALPLLSQDNDVFIVVNGDVYTDYRYSDLLSDVSTHLLSTSCKLSKQFDAHLMLVENPEHNPKGDFQLEGGRLVNLENDQQHTYTFTGIAVYHKRFFEPYLEYCIETNTKQAPTVKKLAPMLRASADKGKVSASLLKAAWTDVGTPERLALLNQC